MRNMFEFLGLSYLTRPRNWLIVVCFVFAGCRAELYTNLSEQDVNEMVAVLLEQGIDAAKSTPNSGKTWSLEVPEKELSQSVRVLDSHGLPSTKFDSLGELFRKDGLVSTPAEERVRFVYGLSQELSATLSQIDGVLVARVQIVLPNNDPLAAAIKPSSASVFIKYRHDADIGALIPQIKTLVVHSVEGLSYDQVSVATVAADALGFVPVVNTGTDSKVWMFVLVAVLVGLAAIGGLASWFWRKEDGKVGVRGALSGFSLSAWTTRFRRARTSRS